MKYQVNCSGFLLLHRLFSSHRSLALLSLPLSLRQALPLSLRRLLCLSWWLTLELLCLWLTLELLSLWLTLELLCLWLTLILLWLSLHWLLGVGVGRLAWNRAMHGHPILVHPWDGRTWGKLAWMHLGHLAILLLLHLLCRM